MDSQSIKSMNKVGAGIKYFQKPCPKSNRNWMDGSRVVVADCRDSLLVAAQVQLRLEKGVADAQVDLIHRLADDWAQATATTTTDCKNCTSSRHFEPQAVRPVCAFPSLCRAMSSNLSWALKTFDVNILSFVLIYSLKKTQNCFLSNIITSPTSYIIYFSPALTCQCIFRTHVDYIRFTFVYTN
ncbi:hypothetical protein QTP88_022304 [Uroleucon formosanum]